MIKNILIKEFERRKKRRPNYSMRGFAKALGLSPSFVSKMINGKAGASAETVAKVISKLNLPPDELAKLPQEFLPHTPMTKTEAFDFETAALFTTISSHEGISRAALSGLDIAKEKIDASLAILVEKEIVVKKAAKFYSNIDSFWNKVSDDEARKSFRKRVNEYWDRAFRDSREETLNTNLLVCCSDESQKIIFREIVEFQKRVNTILKSDSGKKKVYCLNASIFPVSSELDSD